MLQAKLFKYDEHYDIVASWWQQTNTPQPSKLPPVGVIIYDGDTPLAAGWMIRCMPEDGSIVMFEHFIANPAMRDKRSEAIDMLITVLEGIAYMQGYKVVVATPKYKRLVKRAVDNHGYSAGDCYTVIGKELV